MRDLDERGGNPEREPLEISLITADRPVPERGTWERFIRWLSASSPGWYHLARVGSHEVEAIADAGRLSRAMLDPVLTDASYPRIESSGNVSSLFAWLPAMHGGDSLRVERVGLLLLTDGIRVITLSRQVTDLHLIASQITSMGTGPDAALPTRVALGLLHVLVRCNEQLAGALEEQLRQLESVPVREGTTDFFERAFRLKRELSAAKSDLWRVKRILDALIDHRAALAGVGPEHTELRSLANDTEYLYETVDNIREGVLSIIELHLNVVSFDMNRFMRVLAAVSVLGLIPAIIGGLLGMNLRDQPWQITLPQVAFGVSMGMSVCLYVFLVKGWLR